MLHERALRDPSIMPREARKEGADLHTRGGTNCSTKPGWSLMNEGGGTAGLEEQKGTHRTEPDKLLQAFRWTEGHIGLPYYSRVVFAYL